MAITSNVVYAKDDGSVEIIGNHPVHGDCVVWQWDNDGDKGMKIFLLEDAAHELEVYGREDLARLVREA